MTEQQRPRGDHGARAREVVARDPFWSVVRRRHPDVEIVVLPPEPETATPAGLPLADPAAVAAREDSDVRRRWVRLVGDLGDVHADWQARWVPGGAPDRVRRETTLTVDGADPVVAVARLESAAAALREDGWHVLAPATGLPRVMAGRDGELGRAELQLVLVPDAGRLVLRVRSVDHAVGDRVAHELAVAS
ncbi:hypothetical protein [Nocardioides solisilvae]|uniref:hypothetical protein n=1 Tax=Nocardioides solisilvae TaxID=1542435 RepID=UPI000D74A2EA|nr:hypothetical protein [Nocardioides solisilvae]